MGETSRLGGSWFSPKMWKKVRRLQSGNSVLTIPKRSSNRGSRGKVWMSKLLVRKSEYRTDDWNETRMITLCVALNMYRLQWSSWSKIRIHKMEAVHSVDAGLWREMMSSVIESLKWNGAWKLTLWSPGQKLLHSKWVSITKKHADGMLSDLKRDSWPA